MIIFLAPILRHGAYLETCAYLETDSIVFDASVSPLVQFGSFADSGDKRHNRTTHRHDHSAMRNISTSFDPNKFVCTTCHGEHPVLCHTVEGNDVRLGSPPVFILSDHSFPPMVGECLKIVRLKTVP